MPDDKHDSPTRNRAPTNGQPPEGRYQFTTTTDGQVLLYDVYREAAWLQSTHSVSLDAYR